MKNYFLISVSLSMLAARTIAGPMGTDMAAEDWTWIGAISLGPVWENASQTQTLYLTQNIEKTYVATKQTHTLIDGEVFIGMQKSLPQALQGQLGLAVATTNNAALSGNIWDDAEPNFNNYTYNYQIQHTHVAVKGKVLLDRNYWIMPWVSASLGVGFNNSYGFQNTPLIYEALTSPNFASYTQISFTYTLGAGIQKALNAHWQIGMGYEFANWGRSKLNPAPGQTLNQGLSLSTLYTNGLMFNITWIAPGCDDEM